MINLDKDTVLDLLDKAVTERDMDYRYQQPLVYMSLFDTMETHCVYVDSTLGELRPSCLVGVMLHLAGVPLIQLDVGTAMTAKDLLSVLSVHDVLTATFDMFEFINNIQILQDRGMSWGQIAVAARNGTVQDLVDERSISVGD